MRTAQSETDAPSGPWSMRIRLYAIPLLLCAVAAVHAIQWVRVDRSSWGSGCGFGMFCTVDYHDSRFVKCYAEIGDRRVPIQLNDLMKVEELKIRVMPTDENLMAFCQCVHQRVDIGEEDHFCVARRARSDGQPTRPAVDRIVVEIWGLEMHGQQHFLSSRLVNSAAWGRVAPRSTSKEPSGHHRLAQYHRTHNP